MKQSTVVYIILGSIILLILILLAYGYVTKPEAATSTPQTVEQPSASSEQTQPQQASQDTQLLAMKYPEFSPEVLENTADKKRVLFFYANWCPTCAQAQESISSGLSQIPDDVVIIRTNYNDDQTDEAEKKLAEKFGVTYQHTFVQIDAEGTEVTKWNGGLLNEVLTRVQ